MSDRLYARTRSRQSVHPGRILRDELEAREMSQTELAHRMGRPLQVINAIVCERKGITSRTALGLEHALGIPAHLWMNLQSNHELSVHRLADQQRVETKAD